MFMFFYNFSDVTQSLCYCETPLIALDTISIFNIKVGGNSNV